MEFPGIAGIRGGATKRVTLRLTLRIGHVAGRVAFESGASTEFVIGRDGRTTGQGLAAAAEVGLLSTDAGVTWVGIVSIPALAFALYGRCSVMLTASHNPPTGNDVKMSVGGQECDRSLEHDTEMRVGTDAPPTDWDDWGMTGTSDVPDAYRNAIVEFTG